MSDIQQEDKLMQVLEAVEYPERYTDEQLQQLLSDEECADYYRLMCDAASAYAHKRRPARVLTLRRIAAIIVVVLLLSGISYAAIRMLGDGERPVAEATVQEPVADVSGDGRQTVPTDSVWTFQNVELQDILTEVTAYYQLQTDYRHEQTRHIRFYVKWNKQEGVEPIMERLNMSEKVNITLDKNVLIVE